MVKATASTTIFPGFEPRQRQFFFVCFFVFLICSFCFFKFAFFFLICFFFLNSLFFLNLLFFFLIYFKGLCHGFLFLHKSRSPRIALITLPVNSFLYYFSSVFPHFIVSGRACITISSSTLALGRSAKNINGQQ